MDIGATTMFAGPSYLTDTDYIVSHGHDRSSYNRDLELARMAEPLGFDSIWGVEHHFTSYSMSPEPLQFLAYMAGQTERVRLGTMVTVVPWHNPARLAGALAMLDNLSGGRVVLGIGRGLGRGEFAGLGVEMGKSNGLFRDNCSRILDGLDDGWLKNQEGEQVPIRPAPIAGFRDRTYASAISSTSHTMMAELGLGLLVVPQDSWSTIVDEVNRYRETYERHHGRPAPRPIVVTQVFCDSDAQRARELGGRYIREYYSACMKHYELGGDHFSNLSGYSHYQRTSDEFAAMSNAEIEARYASLHCCGTPDECIERLEYIQNMTGCAEVLGIFNYSNMSFEESARSMKLFSERVIPTVKGIGLSNVR